LHRQTVDAMSESLLKGQLRVQGKNVIRAKRSQLRTTSFDTAWIYR
jgi:hypothetical protein